VPCARVMHHEVRGRSSSSGPRLPGLQVPWPQRSTQGRRCDRWTIRAHVPPLLMWVIVADIGRLPGEADNQETSLRQELCRNGHRGQDCEGTAVVVNRPLSATPTVQASVGWSPGQSRTPNGALLRREAAVIQDAGRRARTTSPRARAR